MNKKQKSYYDCVQKQIKLFVKREKSRIFKKHVLTYALMHFKLQKKIQLQKQESILLLLDFEKKPPLDIFTIILLLINKGRVQYIYIYF